MGSLKFSALFQPTSLFSLKDSNSTNSGAKSLFLPSPYSIRMAILNQAITLDGVDFDSGDKKNEWFKIVRDTKIEFSIQGKFCINNCFIKILRVKEDKRGKKQKEEGIEFTPGMQTTISFREYIHISDPIEIIFSVQNEAHSIFLKKYLHKINYFGKRGCFFQFLRYNETPSEPNVNIFDSSKLAQGIIQQYDDFGDHFSFQDVNNFGGKSSVKRDKRIFVLNLTRISSSKSYTLFSIS